jgi:ribosome-associated translation inhibitor RaiA
LERHFAPIINCKVTIKKPHLRKQQGSLYQVTIHLSAPRKDLFAGKNPDNNPAHTDVYVAIRDAFDTIERQLKTHFQHLRKEVKSHKAKPIGQIIRLFPQDGYGFIAPRKDDRFTSTKIVSSIVQLSASPKVAREESRTKKKSRVSV